MSWSIGAVSCSFTFLDAPDLVDWLNGDLLFSLLFLFFEFFWGEEKLEFVDEVSVDCDLSVLLLLFWLG